MAKKTVFKREDFFVDQGTHWCMGCGYGAFARIAIEELSRLDGPVIAIADTSCFESIIGMLPVDCMHALHGRAVAVAVGVKRMLPETTVVVFQGDGGMANEGVGEMLHAAAHGTPITVVHGMNGVLGDTGGQFTAAAPIGLPTPTTLEGRDPAKHGFPLKMADIVAQIEGTSYVARMSSHDPAMVFRGQKAFRRALEIQKEGIGLSFLDLITTCPTGWAMTPIDSIKFTEEVIMPQYPVGILKDVTAKEKVTV